MFRVGQLADIPRRLGPGLVLVTCWSIVVEAMDHEGNVIEGFARQNYTAITTDSVRHALQWNDNPDCHLIQARPIKLRFHLNKAKLYSFTPRIRHTHYVPSYD